jgi:hypothetical protein
VTPRADSVTARLTPFLDEEGPLRATGAWRVATLWLPGATAGERPVGAVPALRALLPSIWQADRRRAAVERTLDLATRIVAALRCCEVGAAVAECQEAMVG